MPERISADNKAWEEKIIYTMAKKSKSKSGDEPKKLKNKQERALLLSTVLRLEAQLEEVRTQLQKAQEERGQLQLQLQQAAQERIHLQSQLDWVLYRLEQVNPEQMQSVLTRLDDWLSSNQSPTPIFSEVGIDYTPLANLLAAGRWQKADEMTWQLVLKASGREEEGWLRSEDIANFPCTDLRTIDWYWEHYSSGRFGLSVQQKIWHNVGCNYTNFCDRVGWRVKQNWTSYDSLTFSLDAPEGHLPVLGWRRRSCYGVGQSTASEIISYLLSRLTSCNNASENY